MTALFIAALALRFLVICFILVLIARASVGFHARVHEETAKARLRPAREIVKRRFALGELNEAQYRDMLTTLDAE